MKYLQSVTTLFVVALTCVVCTIGDAQNAPSPLSPKQHVLHLNNANNGQEVAATVGQFIEITLGTVGPGQYDSPQISSRAVRFETVTFPKDQIPAGPTQVYRFRTASKGIALIKVPHIIHVAHNNTTEITDSNPVFAVTIRVH